MITYQREQQQTIPDSEVIIVGVGGAGANMIDRVALDGMEGAQLLALNTDSRTLASTVAKNKVQMGISLTRGLGCGGDPELGLQAAIEVETEIRDALRGHKIVFVCVGLGGGTGSGAAPLVTRIAREMSAFVVVFGTMPFSFEGTRRKEQAETALNELSVLANALVTFDNGRMGQLVLASQGIHDAFAAADTMVSESIRAVTRLVIRPGLINVGLDDLMSSLRATRSRCLFGSGIASGENRSQLALKNALNSPLLDKGKLLKNTETALVHVCGGAEMTLYEVELLMRELSKAVPANAHILFGAAVDESMGDSLSVTIISSLPEEIVSVIGKAEKVESKKKKAVAVVPVIETVEPEVVEELIEEPSGIVAEEMPESEEGTELTDEVVVDDPVTGEEETLEGEGEVDEESVVEQDIEPELKETEEESVVDPEMERHAESGSEEGDLGDSSSSNKEKVKGTQSELLLDGEPRGKFEGEAPNLVDGEDLDIPPFLRKKR